jgi:hypothetical protein
VATVPVTKPLNRNGLNKQDKETVKFWMLYQALTKVDPLPGKETGPVIFVIRQRQEPLTVSQSGF